MSSDNPFNSPRDPALPPYHLRNGITERAEIDRHEAEHRRRLGIMPVANVDTRSDRYRFDAWVLEAFPGGADDERHLDSMWAAWQAAQR